jgi:hypothetical protein
VVDQLNTANGEAELLSALAVDVDGDKVLEVFLLDERSDHLDLVRRDPDGVYRPAESSRWGPWTSSAAAWSRKKASRPPRSTWVRSGLG